MFCSNARRSARSGSLRGFRALLPLYPYAMEALDLSGYELVISSSSAWLDFTSNL